MGRHEKITEPERLTPSSISIPMGNTCIQTQQSNTNISYKPSFYPPPINKQKNTIKPLACFKIQA